jgi:hypothetical protein
VARRAMMFARLSPYVDPERLAALDLTVLV